MLDGWLERDGLIQARVASTAHARMSKYIWGGVCVSKYVWDGANEQVHMGWRM